jgi:lipoyl(octanoyl) transferase
MQAPANNATSRADVEWQQASELVPYPISLADMDARAAQIAAGLAPERVWLLEHPPLYTAGTSTRAADLLQPDRFPVFDAGRGGQYTYHGPGQRIAYVQLNLLQRGKDIRCFVNALECWIIAVLGDFGVVGETRSGRVGVWVSDGRDRENKIAALGIRVRKWVTLHGVSLNVSPDLSHFDGIVPCGIANHGVTSLAALGLDVRQQDVDDSLIRNFPNVLDRLDQIACSGR